MMTEHPTEMTLSAGPAPAFVRPNEDLKLLASSAELLKQAAECLRYYRNRYEKNRDTEDMGVPVEAFLDDLSGRIEKRLKAR